MSLTGSSPTTTTVTQPPLLPPGYNLAQAFSRTMAPMLMGGNLPSYQGQIDYGLNPTQQIAQRMAQGYASSPAPHVMGQAQGYLGGLMNQGNQAMQSLSAFQNPFANPAWSGFGGSQGAPQFFPQPPPAGGQAPGYPGSYNPWAVNPPSPYGKPGIGAPPFAGGMGETPEPGMGAPYGKPGMGAPPFAGGMPMSPAALERQKMIANMGPMRDYDTGLWMGQTPNRPPAAGSLVDQMRALQELGGAPQELSGGGAPPFPNPGPSPLPPVLQELFKQRELPGGLQVPGLPPGLPPFDEILKLAQQRGSTVGGPGRPPPTPQQQAAPPAAATKRLLGKKGQRWVNRRQRKKGG